MFESILLESILFKSVLFKLLIKFNPISNGLIFPLVMWPFISIGLNIGLIIGIKFPNSDNIGLLMLLEYLKILIIGKSLNKLNIVSSMSFDMFLFSNIRTKNKAIFLVKSPL